MRVVGLLCATLLSCTAVAGPITKERQSEFEKALNVIMASVAPNLNELQRRSLIRDYVEAKPNKGQAVEPSESHPFRSAEHEDYDVTGERTLEACQLRTGKPCALLAVNDEIAAEGDLTPKDMPRLHYSGEFEVSRVPIIRAITRARDDVQGYSGFTAPKAMAIHPWGTLFISTGKANTRDAQDAALSACNNDPRRHSRDGNCFVYAVDNQVVISERRQLGK